MESVLIVCDKPPHGTNVTAEAARIAAGLAALGPTIPCGMVLDEDAVYFLVRDTDVSELGVDTLAEPLELLELVEVPLFVIEEALKERGLSPDDLLDYPALSVIPRRELASMIREYTLTVHM